MQICISFFFLSSSSSFFLSFYFLSFFSPRFLKKYIYMWYGLFAGCKRAYLVPIINYAIITVFSIYFYRIKLLLMCTFWSMLCLLVVNFTQTYHIHSLFGQFYSYVGTERLGGSICWWSCMEVRVLFILVLFIVFIFSIGKRCDLDTQTQR